MFTNILKDFGLILINKNMQSSILVQAIGSPFDVNNSSCGKIKPKLFSWTDSPQKIRVLIDHAIHGGLNDNKDNKYKFGWTCESKAIIKEVFDNLKNNIEKYKQSYNKIFTYDEELINLDPELFIYCPAGSNVPWTPKEEYGLHKKTKLVSFLCSNNSMTDGHRYRLSWADRLKDKVDIYGGACNSKQIGGSHCYHHQRKTEAMSEYMFSVVIENIKMNCYFTEKITDCFANGVIPIYYGTKRIEKYFNEDGIIYLNDDFSTEQLSADLYYSKIESIKDNLERIIKMPTSDDFLFGKIMD